MLISRERQHSRYSSRLRATDNKDQKDGPNDLTPKEQGRYSKMVEELQKMGMTPAKAKVSKDTIAELASIASQSYNTYGGCWCDMWCHCRIPLCVA